MVGLVLPVALVKRISMTSTVNHGKGLQVISQSLTSGLRAMVAGTRMILIAGNLLLSFLNGENSLAKTTGMRGGCKRIFRQISGAVDK